jgi:hypothetical protein
MPGSKFILTTIATTAVALGLAASAAANPAGPCEELLYVGVCAPASEQPSPPPQHSFGDVLPVPDTSSGIHAVS